MLKKTIIFYFFVLFSLLFFICAFILPNILENKDLMIITNSGMVIRIPIAQITVMSRVTQGIRLMNLREGQKVSTVSIVEKDEDSSELNETDNVKEEA